MVTRRGILAAFFLSITPRPLRAGIRGLTPWGKKHVPVIDHGPEFLSQSFKEVFDSINKVMPKHGPRFRYRRGETQWCHDTTRAKHGITICMSDAGSGGVATPSYGRGNTLDSYTIAVRDSLILEPDIHANASCHEAMHAATDVADGYGSSQESCVHGNLPTLGQHDRRIIAATYKRKNKRKKRNK